MTDTLSKALDAVRAMPRGYQQGHAYLLDDQPSAIVVYEGELSHEFASVSWACDPNPKSPTTFPALYSRLFPITTGVRQ